ncbi:hypothetical protein [Pleurocapsa sp. PCC 7327]|uniref:hypothetical protein n=1 Tax=Pleurocapsa sp. PCC 7327 TaxID=118163 RepID=UPI001184DF4E|nr:hypothetical protein [Pleurocapsa sp. PCC 7327]
MPYSLFMLVQELKLLAIAHLPKSIQNSVVLERAIASLKGNMRSPELIQTIQSNNAETLQLLTQGAEQ